MVPLRPFEVPLTEEFCVGCTSIAFPAVLREHRLGDMLRWKGRLCSLSEVARLEEIPRASRDGAAVIESKAGIEAVFWRDRRFAIRDGGTWTEHCRDGAPSAVIIRMRG